MEEEVAPHLDHHLHLQVQALGHLLQLVEVQVDLVQQVLVVAVQVPQQIVEPIIITVQQLPRTTEATLTHTHTNPQVLLTIAIMELCPQRIATIIAILELQQLIRVQGCTVIIRIAITIGIQCIFTHQ